MCGARLRSGERRGDRWRDKLVMNSECHASSINAAAHRYASALPYLAHLGHPFLSSKFCSGLFAKYCQRSKARLQKAPLSTEALFRLEAIRTRNAPVSASPPVLATPVSAGGPGIRPPESRFMLDLCRSASRQQLRVEATVREACSLSMWRVCG